MTDERLTIAIEALRRILNADVFDPESIQLEAAAALTEIDRLTYLEAAK